MLPPRMRFSLGRSASLGFLPSAGLAAALLLGLSGMAQAQVASTVTTQPSAANSGEGSGTLASSDVFQLVFSAPPSGVQRRGCLLQNNSTHVQYVYFQGPGMTAPTSGNSGALEAKAVGLDPSQVASGKQGGSVSCATGAGGALQDSVWVAGTSGDTFVAKQQ